MKKSVRPPPERARRAKAPPTAKNAGASLATTLARQLQSFATSVLGNVGTATSSHLTKWIDGGQNTLEMNRLEAALSPDLSQIYPKKR